MKITIQSFHSDPPIKPVDVYILVAYPFFYKREGGGGGGGGGRPFINVCI